MPRHTNRVHERLSRGWKTNVLNADPRILQCQDLLLQRKEASQCKTAICGSTWTIRICKTIIGNRFDTHAVNRAPISTIIVVAAKHDHSAVILWTYRVSYYILKHNLLGKDRLLLAVVAVVTRVAVAQSCVVVTRATVGAVDLAKVSRKPLGAVRQGVDCRAFNQHAHWLSSVFGSDDILQP